MIKQLKKLCWNQALKYPEELDKKKEQHFHLFCLHLNSPSLLLEIVQGCWL